MTSAPEMHPGAKGITPYRQGHLDCLCGLYALINGIRILHAVHRPLSDQKCRDLFKLGMKELTKRRGDSAHHGMSAARQAELAKVLLKSPALQKLPRAKLRPRLSQVTKVEDFDRALRGVISRGAVLLVGFEGAMLHHSVIVGVSSSRVVLFDSAGMQFVNKTSLQFDDGGQGTLTIGGLIPLGFK